MFQYIAKILFINTDFINKLSRNDKTIDRHDQSSQQNAENDVEQSSTSSVVKMLFDIRNKIFCIKKELEEKENDAIIMIEWTLLSKIIDRFIFLLSLIIFAIVTMGIYADEI